MLLVSLEGRVKVHSTGMLSAKQMAPLILMLKELETYMRGWIAYYGATTSDNLFKQLDMWIRRRVRQFIFKQGRRGSSGSER